MIMKVNTEIENIEYRSGWKPVTREGIDQISVVAVPSKALLNTRPNQKILENNNHPKNESKVAQSSDILTVLSELENYKKEINKKLDDIRIELNTLITLILEASTQEPDEEKPAGIKRLFRRNSGSK
jgi:hypothetical protein